MNATAILLIVIALVILWKKTRKVTEVKGFTSVFSPITQKYYIVRDYSAIASAPSAQSSADFLAAREVDMVRLLQYLRKLVRSGQIRLALMPAHVKSAIVRLTQVFPDGANLNVNELDTQGNPGILAITVNKIEGTQICLRKDPASGSLDDPQAVNFFLIHELAHSAREQYEPVDSRGFSIHSKEFKEIESFLVDQALAIGVLQQHPDTLKDFAHCGGKKLPQ